METALRMDPLSMPYNHTLAVALQAAGRLDEAEALLLRTRELDPSFLNSLQALGWIKYGQGDLPAALDYFERLPVAADRPYWGIGPRALAYGKLDRPDDVEEMARLMARQAAEEPRLNLVMTRALIEWGRGDLDAVFDALNGAVDAKLGSVVFLGTSPNWKELRDDPRFDEIVRRIGLPEEARAS